ncbi:LLM class flavin-dependent oxidoreductase [Priestia flexa]|uniref:LLM class flavin-dependent oxidoreductase n=1 Tax=Priestia flexa TaxID=86664 RepID=UPI002890A3EB|nr:LLM class flavin-dependent oxidoreductase [Priestia flexa]MDT2046995.1 LLM class flavin-dependent oxidoreductase [Priestia flexa]
MKLSILDQSPIRIGQEPQHALVESVELAKAADRLGYTRYWMSEHHDLKGLASSAPEVMLSYIGAQTKRIRLGSGAVLLPYYKPYKVAEVYNTLSTMLPGRIDVGLGRAPGGGTDVMTTLSDNFLQQAFNMPALVEELLHFLQYKEKVDTTTLKAAPLPLVPPVPWILGTSKKSALLAAKYGMPYAFGQFMSAKDPGEVLHEYRMNFQPHQAQHHPKALLTVSVICAETDEKAKELALSAIAWNIQSERGENKAGLLPIREAKEYIDKLKDSQVKAEIEKKILIGSPRTIKHKLKSMQDAYQVDEFMIVTFIPSLEERLQSYTLLANEIINKKTS